MTQESISPNPHFKQDRPEAYILCVNCREPLWSIEVRGVKGTVASTHMEPIGRNIEPFKDKEHSCPLCSRDFGKSKGDGKREYLVKSIQTGKLFTL